MAHILDFEITGLAGRKDVYAQTLNEDVNIFFGLNGTGKTSLLRILAAALERDASGLMTVPFRGAKVRIWSAESKTAVTLSLDKAAYIQRYETLQVSAQMLLPHGSSSHQHFFSPPSRRVSMEPLAWSLEPEPNERHSKYRYNFLSIARLYFGSTDRRTRPRPDVEFNEEALNAAFDTVLTQQWTSFFSETQFRVRASQQEGLVNILQEVLTNPAATKLGAAPQPEEGAAVAYSQIERFLKRQDPKASLGPKKQFESRFRTDPLLRNVVGHIERVEAQVDQAMAPQTKLQELLGRLLLRNKHFSYNPSRIDVLSDNDERIGLSSLSSGEKHLLRIFLEAMLAPGGPLLIDEPELSMHIDWQRELIGDIRELNSTSQVIVATHSPEIMAHFDDSRIFRI